MRIARPVRLAELLRDAQNGVEPEELAIYPGLAGHFQREAVVRLKRKRVELGDEA